MIDQHPKRQVSSYKETLISSLKTTSQQFSSHLTSSNRTHQKPTMEAPRNWLTMELNSHDTIPVERIPELDVYIEPRLELKPCNRFLERAGFIFTGPTIEDHYLLHKVIQYLAHRFGCNPMDFSIFRIDNPYGDLMVLFPSATMAQQATHHGVAMLQDKTEVCLHPYSPGLSMIFDPIYIRARIRLHGVPPQH